MTEDNVIPFPSWRREAHGAPGVDLSSDPVARATRAVRDARHDPTRLAWTPRRSGDGAITDRHGSGGHEAPDRHGDDDPDEQPLYGGCDDVDGLDEPVWHERVGVRDDVVVRMRVDMLGLRPRVWRRLVCRGDLTLEEFHPVLAAAFDRDPDHPHRFRDVVRTSRSTRIGPTFANRWTRRTAAAPEETQVLLAHVLAAPRDRLRYSWGRRHGFEFSLVAEDVMPLPPASVGEVPPALCVAGRRAAPPRDFAAVGLYEAALGGWNGLGSRVADLFDMHLPQDFDPEAFDLDAVALRVRAAAEL